MRRRLLRRLRRRLRRLRRLRLLRLFRRRHLCVSRLLECLHDATQLIEPLAERDRLLRRRLALHLLH
eukprot:3663556-Prymnesium_polylepis.1